MKAELHIQVAEKSNRSFLKHSYFTTPFKVMNITEDKSGADLHLMLMSSSPGILDGDEYDIKIDLEQNSSLHLYTQAYQRLFNMKQGAVQNMEVHIAANASFYYLPHPSVPHEQSIFTAKNNFYLAANSCLFFGELLTCGRKLNGEAFLFSKYQSVSNIYQNGKLVIKENLLMQPALIDVYAVGQLEGYTHQASMICIDSKIDTKQVQQLLVHALNEEIGLDFGVSITPANGLIIRMLGNGAEHLYALLKKIPALIHSQISF